MSVAVFDPYSLIFDRDGQPLENGYLWFGTAAQNPQTNPIVVYWDQAGTQIAAQPIRTSGGYPVRNGAPARVYVNADDYSLVIRDKNSRLVSSQLNAARFGAAFVEFIQSGTGAIYRTVQAKLRETVSVTDFGAVGDGIIDDTVAIQAALNTGLPVYVPPGTFLHATGLTFTANGQSLFGMNGASILKYSGAGVGISFNAKSHCKLVNLQIQAPSATKAVYVGNIAHWSTVSGCDIRGSSIGSDVAGTVSTGNGIEVERSYYCNITGNDISLFAKGIYGLNEFNGNFVHANSIRACDRGVHITDTTRNSDGSQIILNEIEGGTAASSLYGIDIQGSSNMMVAHNRIEYSPNGTAHIYVHDGAGTALRHSLTDNHCVGTIAALKLGDNSGASRVRTLDVRGGYYFGTVTIGVDCDWTHFDVGSNRAFAGGATPPFTNASTTSILSFRNDQTFTVSLTGCTTTPTGSWLYTVSNGIVTLTASTVIGTSNTTACTLTGLPALIRPVSTQWVMCNVIDNGVYAASKASVDSSGTITLYQNATQSSPNTFTAAGTKGFIATTITYPLN
jgi:hypothetical protein